MLYIDGKNICEFTVDGKIETDTANLIFLSDWFKYNLDFILSNDDKFPVECISGDSGIELIEKAFKIAREEENDDENMWFENFHEWCERHLWTFSGTEMVFPKVAFRRVDDKIEISWYNTDKYKNNKKYKIEFTNLKGKSLIEIEEFKKEIFSFIRKNEELEKILKSKMKIVFEEVYFKSDYLYERKEENHIYKQFLKEINELGYNFNTIYDLMILNQKNKNILPIFLKYLKLFDVDTRKHLVRFLGVKGFYKIVPLLIAEFYETNDFDYRISIANTLGLIQDENSLEELLKIIKKSEFRTTRIPIIYRIHNFSDTYKIKKVLNNLLKEEDIRSTVEYALKNIENQQKEFEWRIYTKN